MSQQVDLFRVFIASPSDLPEERRAIRDAVDRINTVCSKETVWRIELLGWEDTLPGAGRAQDLINADLDKADLFVGCLWQRWGTPASISGKTGFEEEFDRAVDRKKRTGLPEIWLFFREIEPVRKDDPGEQLRKVLAFRQNVAASKLALYKEFKDPSEWRDLIHDLLLRRVFKLLVTSKSTDQPVQSPAPEPSQAEASRSHEKAPTQSSAPDEAFRSLAEILQAIGNQVDSGTFVSSDRTPTLSVQQSARLMLFAASWYDSRLQHIELGTHEVNSVYLHRANLQLTTFEQVFLVRCTMLDGSLTKPGWFWARQVKAAGERIVRYYATTDSQSSTRRHAIELATAMRLRIKKRRAELPDPIDEILGDAAEDVKVAGLRYLAVVGRKRDLRRIRPFLTDDSARLRTEAERAKRTLSLRVDPDDELQKSVQSRQAFDDSLISELEGQAHRLSDRAVEAALAHPSGAVRTICARQLVARGRAEPELARRMVADEANAVKECGYRMLIRLNAELNASEVHDKLRDPYYSTNEPAFWAKGNHELVIAEYLAGRPPDELWMRVSEFDELAHLALQALGAAHFENSADLIRAELRDDFRAKAETARAKQDAAARSRGVRSLLLFDVPSATIERVQKALRVAALRVLANRPCGVDRSHFLRFLSTEAVDYEQTVECVKGLAAVGQAEDRERLRPLLESKFSVFEGVASRAYLRLSSNVASAVKDLVDHCSASRMWALVEFAIETDASDLWHPVEPQLLHADENVRRFACFMATTLLKRRKLVEVLERYTKNQTYFYNVVTILDRALFAPSPLREHFLKMEKQHWESWRKSVVWKW